MKAGMPTTLSVRCSSGFAIGAILSSLGSIHPVGAQTSESTATSVVAHNHVRLQQSTAASKIAAKTASRFIVPYEKYVLNNGLTVILHHDASQNNVAVNVVSRRSRQRATAT